MIGASPHRKEDARLLRGAGRFLDDLRRADALHLGVVRSAHAHARVVKVATAEARALPGVAAVWTAADLPEVARSLPPGPKARAYTHPVLAGDRVRYVGEPVAVVVASDPYVAADAVAAVRVTYEPLPPVVTPAAGLTAPALHAGWPDNAALVARGAVGEVEPGFAEAAVVVSERFRHPRLAAAPLEARGVLAEPDPDSGGVVLWSSSQAPYNVRDAVAGILGIPAHTLRVRVPDMGGGFGPKNNVHPEEVLAVAAARRLGRPVKWVQTRREDFAATGHDREQEHEARLGLTRDGVILAVEDSFLADVGAYPQQGDGLTMNTVNHLPGPYRVPRYRSVGTSVVTTKTQNAAYRAAGRPEAVFVMERLLDLGARRLGLDPAEIRRRNLVRPGEMPYRPGLVYKDGVPVAYDPGDFPAAFERLLTLLDYRGWRARQAASAPGARRIGVGLACYAQGTGLGPCESATVRVDPSGEVLVLIGVTGQGQGHATTLAQIAAGELGLPLDRVTVLSGDTALVPYGMGTGGSRVTANAGPAVARAAREVRERAARVAADLLECAPADVRLADGRAHVAGMPDRAVALGRVAQAAVRSKALKPVGEAGLNACTYFYPDTVTWAFGAQGAAVEVDVETGAVRLLAYAAIHDPGRAIHPVIVEAQLHGGIAQGVGAALAEEVVYDAGGQLLTASFMDYAIPKAADLPALAVLLDEHPSVINDLGVKGVGESGCIGGVAAIANAIDDAVGDLGVTVREAPVTPARLHALLGRPRA